MTYPRSTRNRVVSIVIIAALAAGCEHADPLVDEPVAPTFTSIQQSVFSSTCAISGCHLGGGAAAQLDLSAGNAFGNLVGVSSVEVPTLLRVEAGNPDDSYLVQKIEGAAGIVGARMPRGRDPLPPDRIQAIRDWIAAGALNE